MLKNLFYLTAFSTLVVVVIIALDVYHNYKVSTLPPKTQTNIIPINPKFDTETLENLKNRKPVIVNLQDKSSVTSEDPDGDDREPTPTISVSPQASGSSTIQPVSNQ